MVRASRSRAQPVEDGPDPVRGLRGPFWTRSVRPIMDPAARPGRVAEDMTRASRLTAGVA